MTLYKTKLTSVVTNSIITGIDGNLICNTIGNISLVMKGRAEYEAKSNGLFTAGRTTPTIALTDGTSSPTTGMFFCKWVDESTISIWSQNIVTDDLVEVDFRQLDFKIEVD